RTEPTGGAEHARRGGMDDRVEPWRLDPLAAPPCDDAVPETAELLERPGPPVAMVRDVALEDGEGRGGPRGRDVLDRAGDLGHVREADARSQEGADLVVEAPPRLDPPERLEDEAIAVDHRRVGLLDAEAPGFQTSRLREGGPTVPYDEAEVTADARHPPPPPERL